MGLKAMLVKIFNELDLTKPDDNIRVGKHSIWLTKENIKVPFQWGGRVQKYKHPKEATYDLWNIAEEYAMVEYLAGNGMAPPLHGWVYFKTVISDHIGAWWADPCGAYGYITEDANTLPKGKFDYKWMQSNPLFKGSEGAWNDIMVPERQNVVNGYLVDVRRSVFDMINYSGDIKKIPIYTENREHLLDRLQKEAQFPFKERENPYQEFYLDGEWHSGEREVVKRAEIMKFSPRAGQSVLDIGCQLGGFLQYAAINGAVGGRLVGVDIQTEYVDLARSLARASGWNICFRSLNVEEEFEEVAIAWFFLLFGEKLDYLLLMSMYKHFKKSDVFWDIIDLLEAENTYLESNAIKSKDAVAPFESKVLESGGSLVGFSEDRNLRKIFCI